MPLQPKVNLIDTEAQTIIGVSEPKVDAEQQTVLDGTPDFEEEKEGELDVVPSTPTNDSEFSWGQDVPSDVMVSQATQLAGRIGKRSSSTGEIVWMPDNQFRVALKDAKDKKEAALMALLKSGKVENKILIDKFEESESVHEELIFQAV